MANSTSSSNLFVSKTQFFQSIDIPTSLTYSTEILFFPSPSSSPTKPSQVSAQAGANVRTHIDEEAQRAKFNENTIPLQLAKQAKAEGKEVCIWFWSSMEPITVGHCSALLESAKLLGATKIIFVPNRVSPFKLDRPIRMEIDKKEMMIRSVIADMQKQYAEISWEMLELEIREEQPSYTINSMRDLTDMGILNKHRVDQPKEPKEGRQDPKTLFGKKDPKTDFAHFAIFGADILSQLHTWREGAAIPDYIETFFVARPGYNLNFTENVPQQVQEKLQNRAILIPEVNVSSSAVFDAVQKGASIKGLVPSCIENFVEESLKAGIEEVERRKKEGLSVTHIFPPTSNNTEKK